MARRRSVYIHDTHRLPGVLLRFNGPSRATSAMFVERAATRLESARSPFLFIPRAIDNGNYKRRRRLIDNFETRARLPGE